MAEFFSNQKQLKGDNKPEHKFVCGSISATIWNNVTQKDGKDVSFKNVVVERRYKDSNGAWKGTNSFRLNDLPKIILAAQLAYEYLVVNKNE